MSSFSTLGLNADILKAVAEAGYDTPTPIQEQAIPVALTGLDVLGIAQTGTGKTASFTLPLIDRLSTGRAKARMPRALVLAPTRELADQVAQSFEKYAKYTKLSWALLIGGVSFGDQEAKLDRGVDVLIATPGRLLDHFERGKLLMTGVQVMVVDEADRMLDMGFIPDIERIFKLTPPKRQTLFFSATMAPEITRITEQFLKNPTRIEVARPATTADTISQFVCALPHDSAKGKRTALRELIAKTEVKNGIVFCNRKTDVDIVAKSLQVHGVDALPIHGDLDQSQRMKTLDQFRNGELKILVASDVAARGLDIPDVGHVFNYDVPHHADDYVHRIGRTGRAGRTGEAYIITTPKDSKGWDKVLKLIKKTPEAISIALDWDEIFESEKRHKSKDTKERAPRGRGRKSRDETQDQGQDDYRSSRSRRSTKDRIREEIPAPQEAGRDESIAPDSQPLAAKTPQPNPGGESRPLVRSQTKSIRPERDLKGPRGFGDFTPAFMSRSAFGRN